MCTYSSATLRTRGIRWNFLAFNSYVHVSYSEISPHISLHVALRYLCSGVDWPEAYRLCCYHFRWCALDFAWPPAHATECGQHYLKIRWIDFFLSGRPKQCGFKSVHAHVDEATDSFSEWCHNPSDEKSEFILPGWQQNRWRFFYYNATFSKFKSRAVKLTLHF